MAAVTQTVHHYIHTEQQTHRSDGIKDIVSLAMVIVGVAMIAGASIALAGHFFAAASTIGFEKIQALFTMGILSALGGFHLVNGSSNPSFGFDVGLLTVTV